MFAIKRILIGAVLVFTALSLHATMFVVPVDRDLVHRADAIVIGSPLSSYARLTAEGGIETVTTFSVSEVISGMSGDGLINIVEPGGTYGSVSTVIAGVPQFMPGERLMLFLKRTGSDRWAVEELVLGKFRFTTDTRSRELLVRDAEEIVGWNNELRRYQEQTRAAAPFLRFVRSEARGVTSSEDYFVKDPAPLRTFTPAPFAAPPSTVAPAATFSATSYTMTISGSLGSRWTVFPNPVTFFTGTTAEPGAPGGGATAAQTALAAWTNDCPSNVNYVYGGTDNGTHTQGLHGPDGANTILFERDLSTWGISPFSCGSGGTLGLGGITTASGQNTVNGETFVTTQEADVEMNRGIANCTSLFNSGDFNTAVTHEVGHTLGFRHSDQNRASTGACTTDPSLECSNQAVMKSFIPTGINATLQPWDLNAVRLVYPGGSCVTPSGPPKRGDLDGNGISDIVWRDTSTGANTVWNVNSGGLTSSVSAPSISTAFSIVAVGDFNKDGRADILWRNLSTGQLIIWFMNGNAQIGSLTLGTVTLSWSVVGAGDLNGDGYADIFWRNTQDGQDSVWLMTAGGFTSGVTLNGAPVNYKIFSVADFNGDGRADILWRNTNTGDLYTWILNPDGTLAASSSYLGNVPLTYAIAGTGDFNGDATFDILWRNTQTGNVSVWFLHNGGFIGGGFNFGDVTLAYQIVGVGDFNGDGTYDILWRNESAGANSIWFITPTGGFVGGATLPTVAGSTQKIVSPPPL